MVWILGISGYYHDSAAALVIPDHELGDPVAAAAGYAEILGSVFVGRDGVVAPDLVVLGIGDDGHTASLFPGTDALDERDAIYTANWVGSLDTWRLTATFPLLWSARTVAFLVAGSGKASVLAEIIEGAIPYPAQEVAAGAADVVWLLDADAASQLRNRPR